MKRTTLSGRSIPPMTLGTAQLSMEYGIANRSGKPAMDESFRIVRTALESGITCFDTAKIYGDSERILGEFMAAEPVLASDATIVTKIKLSPQAPLAGEELRRQVTAEVEDCLSRLRMAKLPLLLLHQPEDLRGRGEEMARILRGLKQDGLIEAAGVSLDSNSDEQYDVFWPFIRDDLYEAIQIPINLLDQRLIHNGALRSFADRGKVVFARSVFLQGLFFLDDDRLPERIRDAARKPLRMIRELAEQEGMSIAQLAVSFVRDMPEIGSLVVGAETVEQMRNNAVLMNGPSIGERARSIMLNAFKKVPRQVYVTTMW